MDYSNPTLLVISGPNGAGKSTHIQTMLPPELDGFVCFDRDKTRVDFENTLIIHGHEKKELFYKATKMMEDKLLEEMKISIQQRSHFVLETPLSHGDYWRYIDLFQKNGYQIHLCYLCLDKINDCIARVGQRVLEGGHYVAPNTIKGVYEKNLEHINAYMDTFTIIELYDGMRFPVLLARFENGIVNFSTREAMKKKWIVTGLPALAKAIKASL